MTSATLRYKGDGEGFALLPGRLAHAMRTEKAMRIIGIREVDGVVQ